jgi:hypothetical protein
MATVAIQQPIPPRSPMIRKRTFSSSSDGMHYGPRVSKQPKTARRQSSPQRSSQRSPQRKRKLPVPEEKKKLDSAFVGGAKVDLEYGFVPPTASNRDRHSAAKEAQAGLEKKCAERQAMVSNPVGRDSVYGWKGSL